MPNTMEAAMVNRSSKKRFPWESSIIMELIINPRPVKVIIPTTIPPRLRIATTGAAVMAPFSRPVRIWLKVMRVLFRSMATNGTLMFAHNTARVTDDFS